MRCHNICLVIDLRDSGRQLSDLSTTLIGWSAQLYAQCIAAVVRENFLYGPKTKDCQFDSNTMRLHTEMLLLFSLLMTFANSSDPDPSLHLSGLICIQTD